MDSAPVGESDGHFQRVQAAGLSGVTWEDQSAGALQEPGVRAANRAGRAPLRMPDRSAVKGDEDVRRRDVRGWP